MKKLLLSMVAGLVAVMVIGGVFQETAGEARACGPQLVADVNPSAVGEAVTFDVGCLKHNWDYFVGVFNWSTNDTVIIPVTGDFSHTFTEAGGYHITMYAERNRATAEVQVAYAAHTVN